MALKYPKPKKKKKRKSFGAIGYDRADKLFSDYIRLRAMKRIGGCEKCKKPKASYKDLQCSHYWGRGKKSVRCDPENAVGICAGCHSYLGSNPHDHREWWIEKIGKDRYDALTVRARLPAKYIDKKALQIGLLAMCRELDPYYEPPR